MRSSFLIGCITLALGACGSGGGGTDAAVGGGGNATVDSGTNADANLGGGLGGGGTVVDAQVVTPDAAATPDLGATSPDLGVTSDASVSPDARAPDAGVVECTMDDCGPIPPVAPCPGGIGPDVVCERRDDGACGWNVSACPTDCGGFAGLQCAPDEYCDFPDGAMCGAADQSGTCQPRPAQCPPIDGIVCACDGREYESDCAAAAAGADVSSEGPCAQPVCPDGACGGPPPVAACPGGGGPPLSCEPDSSGVCSWHVGECPAQCAPDTCGPVPPVAPCPGGGGPTVSCEPDAAGVCGWHVGECPPVCSPDVCGPVPRVPACPDGVQPTVTCEPDATGACGWNIGPCGPVPCAPDACGRTQGSSNLVRARADAWGPKPVGRRAPSGGGGALWPRGMPSPQPAWLLCTGVRHRQSRGWGGQLCVGNRG